MSLKLSKSRHVRSPAEFDRVYQARVYAADDVLVVNGCRNDLPYPRLGLSVSRKVGNAVVRIRWKRRIREAFRLSQHELPLGIDLVVRPQKGATLDFHAISRSLPALAARIGRRLEKGRREQRLEVREQKDFE